MKTLKSLNRSYPDQPTRKDRGTLGIKLAALLFAALAPLSAMANKPATPQGTWTPLTNLCPEGPETALLLTDGTILVKSFDIFNHAFKLTPTADGNYVNATWSRLPDMPVGLIYGPCEVLRDGRAFIAGGEYLMSGATDYNTCEIYNPVTNSWTQGPDGLFGDIGDTGNSIMSDGRILVSNRFTMQTQVFDPTTMSWSSTGSMTNFTGDEESWQILPDNTILNVFNIGQRYFPTTGEWVPTTAMPANNGLVDAAYEIGPAMMLYNGQVLTLGGTNNTVLYTPPTTLNGGGSWTVGPKIPNNMTCPDCPGVVEPNGKVLFISTPTDFAGPNFNEYDPTTNTMTAISGPPNNQGAVSFTPRFLTLPNGQILMTGWGTQCYLYTPVGTGQTSWRAKLTSAVRVGSSQTYTLTGSQLNGLTGGGGYGDDASMSTNYPIVILRSNSNGKVYYAKSFNFSTMGISVGSAQISCQFTVPASMPAGGYTLTTSASGLTSSNSLQLGLYIPPTAVQIYDNQGTGATGGVNQLFTVDQQYYTIKSVPNTVGQVAAAQITFQVPTGSTFASVGCSLNVSAPLGTTSFIYLYNYKTAAYDLIGTTNLGIAGQTVSASASSSANYISPTGQVIAVNRIVAPGRSNAPQMTVKWDLASLTS